MRNLKKFIRMLDDVIECATQEMNEINTGKPSMWRIGLLENVVLPELNDLLMYALKGDGFPEYRESRRLVSVYFMTDSLEMLHNTILGVKILELQEAFNCL